MATTEQAPQTEFTPSLGHKIAGYGVHLYTASGIIFAFLAAIAIFEKRFFYAWMFMLTCTIIDSTDGWMARKVRVKEVAKGIDGGKLDDIVDYITYTFLPILMIWRAGWLPEPAWVWLSFPLVLSLFGFANTSAKESDRGFFTGFPSYWNFVAFYIDVWFQHVHPYVSLAAVLFFAFLTIVPLRFIYPSRSRYWQSFFVWGAIVWTVVFVYVLWNYQENATSASWVAIGSFAYPFCYLTFSLYFDFLDRKKQREELATATAAG